ncbi:hypothetical protein OWV82_016320 [Melia azedarach]|uniref:Uncharacterized protein n=1 Tax=Melia azedarach TaxID=155640 RepID=A0ACC1XGS9_MELAZ|nr:hypothetical protein OWV82_016320 [Melia azedarach]
MANGNKKKNPKRLECLKKKTKELSILCDVEVLFLCKEDDPSSDSFYWWPEDRNSCLSLIDKYKRSSGLAKSYKKKKNAVPLSPVLGKRKERSDAHMEVCEIAQENKKLKVGFVDGLDSDDFYGAFWESVQETQTELWENLQEEKFELGVFDGVEFGENCGRFCELIQENQDLGDKEEANENRDTFLCQNFVQEIDFCGKFCETAEENTDWCQNVQTFEGFQNGYFDGLDTDEICSNLCKSFEENRDLSYTQMLLCENVQETEGFEMGFLGGRNFCESIPENSESEIAFLNSADSIISKLGQRDLKNVLEWIDDALSMLKE